MAISHELGIRRFFDYMEKVVNDGFKVAIISPPDRKHLTAEIMFGGEQWAELNHEGVDLLLEVYPKQDGQPWRFNYYAAVEALAKAKERLVGG